MEVRAVAKFIRVQPRKVRILADQVRGVDVRQAAGLLRYHSSKGAKVLYKVLNSAVANAMENNNIAPENLRIATIMVDEGPRLKRITARSMGRANRIVKKMSHVTVVVEEYEPQGAIKPHGTKAKARPSFGAPKKGGKKKDEKPVAAAPAETEEVVEEVAAPVEEVVEETAAPVDEAPAAEATEEVTAEEVMAGADAPAEEEAEAAAPAEEVAEAQADEGKAESEEKGA
jgi:large subunit ribosomal protein L22